MNSFVLLCFFLFFFLPMNVSFLLYLKPYCNFCSPSHLLNPGVFIDSRNPILLGKFKFITTHEYNLGVNAGKRKSGRSKVCHWTAYRGNSAMCQARNSTHAWPCSKLWVLWLTETSWSKVLTTSMTLKWWDGLVSDSSCAKFQFTVLLPVSVLDDKELLQIIPTVFCLCVTELTYRFASRPSKQYKSWVYT